MKLFRVYTHTSGDESITERLVGAVDEAEASKLAILNVKAQNLGKGLKDESLSRENTSILSVKECGKGGVLCTNRFPIKAISELFNGLNPTLLELQDHKSDILRIAGIPEDSTLDEAVITIQSIIEDRDQLVSALQERVDELTPV